MEQQIGFSHIGGGFYEVYTVTNDGKRRRFGIVFKSENGKWYGYGKSVEATSYKDVVNKLKEGVK